MSLERAPNILKRALLLSSKNVRDLSVAWNDAYRRIFHNARWESVKELMYFCGDLDMEHLYNMHRWEFMIDVRNKFSYCTILLEQLEFNNSGLHHFSTLYKCYSRTHCRIKPAVLCKFTQVVGNLVLDVLCL